MRISRVLAAASTVAAASAATVVATASGASAELLCREATLEDYSVAVVCALVEPNRDGTTVAPVVWIGCSFDNGNGMCVMDPIALAKTGVTPASTLPTIQFDVATLTVYSTGGHVGTVWVNGTPVPVSLPSFCVGDPAIC